MKKLTVRDIVIIGICAAIIFVSTKFLMVPFGLGGAMVHMGSAAIFSLAAIFGGVNAGLAAAIASVIVDMMGAFPIYAPWSFVIKGTVGFVVGTIVHGMFFKENGESKNTIGKTYVKLLLGGIVGSGLMLAGYLVAWRFVLGSWAVAIANAPASLMTSSAGLIVSLVVVPPLKIALKKSGFYDRNYL